MHDQAALESRGVPGVYVASVEFAEAAEAQAAALGFTPASVFVAHPIQDRTDGEMRELARGALARVIAAITDRKP